MVLPCSGLGLLALFAALLLLVEGQMLFNGASALLPFGCSGLLFILCMTATIFASRFLFASALAKDAARFLARACAVAVVSICVACALIVFGGVAEGGIIIGCAELCGWMLAGVSFGLAFLLWINVWNVLYRTEESARRKRLFWLQSLALFGAAVLAFLLHAAHLDPAAMMAVTAVIGAGSGVLCWACSKRVLPYELQNRSLEEVAYRALDTRPIQDRLRFLVLFGSYGMIAVALAHSGAEGITPWMLVASVALAQVLLFVVSIPNDRIIKIYHLENVAFMLAAITLLVMIVQNSAGVLVVAGFVISFYLGFTADLAGCILTISLKDDPFASFKTKSLFFSFLGLCAGWAVGCVLAAVLDADALFVALGVAALLLILLDFIFVPFPTLEDDELYEYLNGSDISSRINVAVAEEQAQPKEAGWWVKSLDELARSYGLTDREVEVLALLAKGKNAASIAEEFCISQNTARTHIYRIFKKMDVKTHQQLIVFIEERVSRKQPRT